MVFRLLMRLARECSPRLLWKFCRLFCLPGMFAVERFAARRQRHEIFPAFLFISVTTRCQLSCRGCWVPHPGQPHDLPWELLHRLLREARRHGIRFFGILGGEPLLYAPPDHTAGDRRSLWRALAQYPDCYFQVFTNGFGLDDEDAACMAAMGNVTPLISIEGLTATSDERRGGQGVYAAALAAIAHCRRHGLIIGAASSICRSNLAELVTLPFLEDLVRRGVHYMWYYIYRPTGPAPSPELALSREQIKALRAFLLEARERFPLLLVDSYWDHLGRGLCPAATGIAFHVNAAGEVEPCPPIQMACDNIARNPLAECLGHSPFLQDFSRTALARGRGCILLEAPAALLDMAARNSARDTSGRDFFAELAAMSPQPSHDLSGEEMPERHWFYRLAKKRWFCGFGAYG